MKKKILIAGASGVVGASAVDSFLAAGDEVIALSRRKPEVLSSKPFEHLAVDLRDAQASGWALSGLQGVTHVVYAALFEKPGLIPGWVETDQMDTNLAMLQNFLEPLTRNGRSLRHVSLLQGTKAYGLHLHPMAIPARERLPRDPHANFYWLQEDYLHEQAAAHKFDFTILRPQLVIGGAHGVAMNLPPVLGAYAAICRAKEEPFGFPGGVSYVWEAVDARLLADVFVWAAEAPKAVGQHFNVTNGDVFEWRNLWPAIADTLGIEVGPDMPRALQQYLPENSGVWDEVVARHKLRKLSIKALCGESHYYADFCFAYGATEPPPPAFVSAIKLRQSGFTDVYDTEDTFRYWLQNLIDRNILPSA
jgi:nucleoside-diphosphate-sugar epimerase